MMLVDFDTLWDYTKPAETELKFRDLIPIALASGDNDYYLQLQTQIARTQGLQRKFEEAHATLDSVERQLDATTEIARIRYLLERGRVFNSSKRKPESLPYFIDCYKTASANGRDAWAVDAAHMVAIAETGAEEQMKWNLIAMDIAQKSSDPKARKWVGSLSNNMGWTYHDAGQFDKALEMFKKSLDYQMGNGNALAIRIGKWAVARALRSLNQTEESLKIQLQLEKEIDPLPEKDGYVYEELGELFLILGEKNQSQKYFGYAYDIMAKDEWLVANDSKRLERIKSLS
jgi:tetratricopeptide (TPR) repeat protein